MVGKLVGGLVKLLMPFALIIGAVALVGFGLLKGTWALIHAWVFIWS